MPAKKAKAVKKQPVKKAAKIQKKPAKKPATKTVAKPVKKTVAKAVKKPVKKLAAKPVKKLPAKKVVKPSKTKVKPAAKPVKQTKKPAAKTVQKPVKKTTIKPVKKSVEKTVKKVEEKVSVKNSKISEKILAKGKMAREEKKAEEEKAAEKNKKTDSYKSLFLRKNDGNSKVSFKVGEYAVYPSHGVGKIVEIEKSEILGQDFSCYLMYFEKEKLNIKIPVKTAGRVGLRHLVSKAQMDEVFVILRSGVKKLKGMWSRRAQEYETKINSGDITLLAEVLRDLTRDIEDSERSYSERIIYETAIYRLASEYAAIYGTSFEEARDKVILTAKDKLNAEGRIVQKDDFDEFDDFDSEKSDSDDEENEDEEEEDEEEEDDDFDYDDDDDDKPRKKKRK